jgi:mono/diheme cytochrome c family protein
MRNPMKKRALEIAGLAFGLVALAAPAAHAQRNAGAYPEATGEAIYKNICQGCHMPNGKGAEGAGMYPALAGDKRLAGKAYPAMVVVRGQKAMPEFGTGLSDVQVAAVVNYVRTHLGNDYRDVMTTEEVTPLRPKKGVGGEVKPPG